MGGSVFGKIVRLSTFGESHGKAIGGVVDGFPAGFELDFDKIQLELDRRKPGQSKLVSQRKESDQVEFLSGIFEGKTTGAPIGFLIQNEDARSKDYSHLKDTYRPSHADFTYDKKFGIRDYRGGGRSSARETACRVVAGAMAKQFLESKKIKILSYVDQIGNVKDSFDYTIDKIENVQFDHLINLRESNEVRALSKSSVKEMADLVGEIKKSGDTIGGSVRTIVFGAPLGLGEPVFDKLHAELGKAMLSINAVKGFEIGSGFDCVTMKGSQHNDIFKEDFSTKTNFSGGVQGGISNGMPIYFRTAFKPVATILRPQESVNSKGKASIIEGKGRHDACVVPRAVPIVDAMTALVLMDFMLRA